ncbi:MAG: hypothetical protein COU73_02960 [Parcubacteria group bacterium CG10_big_fil_rev_8_21_14_0_10_46_32]|nr:MAG: hypothetical protein COU73_02960 [Parcubacteria group bacterium CG10_big_fil_rev_8_21_14_0_10_46_32]
MRYFVVESSSLDSLIEEVNKLLKQGWSCQGGIATYPMSYPVFYQAMIHP